MAKGHKDHSSESSLRSRIAHAAAKVMAEERIGDYHLAKQKAISRLGLSSKRELPSNQEVEAALLEYQRLFMGHRQPQEQVELYKASLEALDFFSHFRPRLVGAVLQGTADSHTPIELHLFSDHPEAVIMHMLDHGVPYTDLVKHYRWPEGVQEVPAYGFLAGGSQITVAVFPEKGIRRPPLSPLDGRPMRRAGRDEVQALSNKNGPYEEDPYEP